MRLSRSTCLGIFLIAGIIFLTRLPSIFVPILDVDEAMFANMSRDLLRGDVLYIDTIDHKPPLMYAFYAATLSLHNSMLAVHIVTMLWVLATALILWKLAELWCGKRCGFAAALLFAMFSSMFSIATTTETVFNLPLCAAMICATYAHNFHRLRWAFISGILFGCATLVKHQALLALPALLFLVTCHVAHHRTWRLLLAGIIGTLFPYALLILWGWQQQNLTEIWTWGYAFNFSYLGAHVPSENMRRMGMAILVNIGLYSLPLWALAMSTAWKERSRTTTQAALLWLAGSCAAVALGLRFYSHYFIQIVPPLAVLAAPTLLTLWDHRLRYKRVAIMIFGIFLFLPVFAKTFQRVWMTQSALAEKWAALEQAADIIRQHSTADDAVFVWGNDTSVLFLANRRSGSRFAHSSMMLGNLDPCLLPKDFDLASLARSRLYPTLLADLEERKPNIFVDTSPANAHCWGRFAPPHFPALSAYLDAYYRPLGLVGGYSLYIRTK